jgi:hypothetical protein
MDINFYIDPTVAKLIITSLLAPIAIALWKRAGKPKDK